MDTKSRMFLLYFITMYKICMSRSKKQITINLDLMELSALDYKITICKIDILTFQLYPCQFKL